MSIKVSAVQMNLESSVSQNMEKIEFFVEKAAREKCNVVCFPECATTGYFGLDKLTPAEIESCIEELMELAAKNEIYLIIGSPRFHSQLLFNSALVINPEGKLIAEYSKIHLTGYDQKYFHPGDRLGLFYLEGIPCALLICYDGYAPELAKFSALVGAKLIFHLCADFYLSAISLGLGVKEDLKRPYSTSTMRAAENSVYFIVANSSGSEEGSFSSGCSKVISPTGMILAMANYWEERLIMVKLSEVEKGKFDKEKAKEEVLRYEELIEKTYLP